MKTLTALVDQVVAAAPGDPGTGLLRIAAVHEVLLREVDRVVELRSALTALESRTAGAQHSSGQVTTKKKSLSPPHGLKLGLP